MSGNFKDVMEKVMEDGKCREISGIIVRENSVGGKSLLQLCGHTRML